MNTFTPYKGFLQLGYVTTNLDQALAIFSERYGIPEFMKLHDVHGTLDDGGQLRFHVGLAYVGDTQIELIEPCGGQDGLYRDFLPQTGFAIRFHHISQLLDSQDEADQLLQTVAARGLRIAYRSEREGLSRNIYTDHVATLGHYMEHMYFTDEGLKVFAKIPRSPGGARKGMKL